jgi:hypothetical protein
MYKCILLALGAYRVVGGLAGADAVALGVDGHEGPGRVLQEGLLLQKRAARAPERVPQAVGLLLQEQRDLEKSNSQVTCENKGDDGISIPSRSRVRIHPSDLPNSKQ